jgi:hypothetical protein
MPRCFKDVFSKILQEKVFIVDKPKLACTSLDSPTLKFTRRLLVFDL